jgi:DNA helicase-2/ATP-dependent DNA helicase PcrA
MNASLPESVDLTAQAQDSESIAARALRLRSEAGYMNALNPEQRDAVEIIEGPVLVLAGAGTGKTRVLTTRIVHILAMGRARPQQILAVTFTNKAAREMRERIGKLIGQSVEGMPWLGTFHSIGRKIVSRHAEALNLSSNFTVLDTDDQLRLLKQILQAENIDNKRWPARLLANLIDGWKNRGLEPDKVPAGDGAFFANGQAIKLYEIYQERLKVLNCLDFGDLLLAPIRLFRTHADILQNYRDRFRYILVDEYQDTNIAQYLWLRLLSSDNANICCVGDDDQSIYGWRGAEVDNILRFEKDFPGAKVIRLERNYRSTGHILGAAAKLISYNNGRLGKTLFSANSEMGDPVTITALWDSEEEARHIGDEIEALQTKKHRLNEIAILVRTSAQMRAFEERFVTLGLPYRVIGGPRFYERQEIRDALAYMRVTVNPDDDLAFERIVNVPKRGLGEASLQQLHIYARNKGCSLIRAARELCLTEEFKPKMRTTLQGLVQNFERWNKAISVTAHIPLAEMVLDESGYMAMWKNEKSPDAQGRIENLKELINALEEFESLPAFLEHISLIMDADKADEYEAVSIMTLHAAKGLEFETVFLPGWEEGLFPSQRSMDENGRAGLEEERRLAYVGLTRAKQLAKISFVQSRLLHGTWSPSIPSRFVNELPEPHVEIAHGPLAEQYSAANMRESEFSAFSGRQTPGWERAERMERTFKAASKGRIIEGNVVARAAQAHSYQIGERVFHQKFGYGKITAIEGDKLTIEFEKAGEKRVVASFVARP